MPVSRAVIEACVEWSISNQFVIYFYHEWFRDGLPVVTAYAEDINNEPRAMTIGADGVEV